MGNSLFKGQIAEAFRDTRYLPRAIARQLVASAVRGAVQSRTIRVAADIGCGPGRFLNSLAGLPGVSEVVGYDLSTDMLTQAHRWCANADNIRLVERNCAAAGALGSDSFDLILLHWVLNTSCAWHEIVGNCAAALRPGGLLVWFQEEGSLYQAIDGDASAFSGSGCEFSHAAWEQFYDALGHWGESESLQKREGISLGSDIAIRAIAEIGFKIVRLDAERKPWIRAVTVNWLIKRVLAARAFSNMWRIPEPVYERAFKSIVSLSETYPQAARAPVWLDFSSTPIVAIKI